MTSAERANSLRNTCNNKSLRTSRPQSARASLSQGSPNSSQVSQQKSIHIQGNHARERSPLKSEETEKMIGDGSREIWGKICQLSIPARSIAQWRTDVAHGRIQRSEVTREIDSSQNSQSMILNLTSIRLIRMRSRNRMIPMTTLLSKMKSSDLYQTSLRRRLHRSGVVLDATIMVTWATWSRIHTLKMSQKTWRQQRSEDDLLISRSSSSKAGTYSITTGTKMSRPEFLMRSRWNTQVWINWVRRQSLMRSLRPSMTRTKWQIKLNSPSKTPWRPRRRF